MSSNVAMTDPTAPFTPPASLDLEEKIAISIGALVMNWANLETLLRGLYCCVTNPHDNVHADITWFSFTSNRARCDLLRRSLNASDVSKRFKVEIVEILDEFRTVTRSRNYYAHAHYRLAPDTLRLTHIEGHQLNMDEFIFSSTVKKASKGTLNEIVSAVNRCAELNRRTYPVLFLLREEVGAQHIEIPQAPPGYSNNPRFRLPHTG